MRCAGCRTRSTRRAPPASWARTSSGSGYDLEIVVHAGAGAYICGEETALLDSLEGRRGQPRLKPPFPAVAGPVRLARPWSTTSRPSPRCRRSCWAAPTGTASMGTEKSPGPKIYSLSGHVTRPGQYEAPMGTTLRQLLVSAGGMLDGIPLKFFTPGGSSTPIFTPAQLDVPLSFDDVAAAGSMLGTTALMCFNETVSVPWAVWKWLEFYKHESCGKCTPCREGTGWLVQILRRMVSGAGTMEDLDTMADAAGNIAGRSFCALGDAAATPILSSFKYFRSEFEDLVTGRTPPVVERSVCSWEPTDDPGCRPARSAPRPSRNRCPKATSGSPSTASASSPRRASW